jgi:hypothetical protein
MKTGPIRLTSHRNLQGAQFSLAIILLFAALISSGCAGYTSANPNTPPPAPSITTSGIPNGQVGTAFQSGLTASGGKTPYTWGISVGALPAGLTMNTSTGMISGTPTQAGQDNFTAQVTDHSTPPQTASKGLTLSITAAPPPLQISSASLSNGQVQVAYSASLSATGGTTPYSWSVSAGSLPTGLALSAAGAITGTPSAAATFNFTVKVSDSSSPAQSATKGLSIVVSPAGPLPLTISTTSLPGGVVGSAYSSTLTATGGATPYSWSLSAGALPTGLALSAAGAITGTPSAAATFNFTVKVSDSSSPAQSATMGLSITVNAAPPPLVVSTSSLPAGTVGTAYSSTLTATGGTTPFSWSVSVGSLPPGLTLNGPSGAIAGAPTQSGTSNFTVQVRDSEASPQTATKALSLIVNPATLQITTTALPPGTVGISYTATFSASGGVAPYTWSISSGLLPAGLSLSTAGTISGTPTAAATSNFQVQVKDSSATTSSAGFSINIVLQGACGGPITYCSRTDMVVQQLPSPLPSVGGLVGAGTVVTPIDFNNPICRVTDANTAPNFPSSTFAAAASGSADENMFNVDSSLILLYNISHVGGIPMTFSFNGTTCTTSRLYASSFPSTGGFLLQNSNDYQWSRANSQILYGIENNTRLVKYDFTNRSTPPTAQLVFDFANSANCLKGIPVNWYTDGGVAVGDSAFGAGFATTGGQDSSGAIYVAVYTVGKGCRVWNMATGQVSGDWGPTGTVSTPDRVELHNMKLSHDGNWVFSSWNHCTSSSCPDGQPLFWNVPTLSVSAISTCPNKSPCPAHQVGGFTSFFFEDANSPPNFDLVPFSNVNSITILNPTEPPGFTSPWDQHPSWNNVTSSDQTPVCMSSFQPPGSPATFTFGWQDEILCVATDGSAKIYRMAHTFNSDRSARFTTSEGIGAVSQDGKFFMWSSDWQGTLGSEGGSSGCTIGGSVNGTNCRGDLFIVGLK